MCRKQGRKHWIHLLSHPFISHAWCRSGCWTREACDAWSTTSSGRCSCLVVLFEPTSLRMRTSALRVVNFAA